MRSICLLVVALACCLAADEPAPGKNDGAQQLQKKRPAPALQQTPVIRVVPAVPVTNTAKAVKRLPLQLPPKQDETSQPVLKPGVYRTAPYACLVLIPGPHPGDSAILQPPAEPRMPMVRPDLKFIPHVR